MYDFLNDNPAVESRPVDYANDPRVIAQNDNVVSINATIQIDLTGACNSEHMLGHQYSASGGQVDYRRTVDRREGQGLTDRRSPRWASDDTAYRHALHRDGVWRRQSQGSLF